MILIGGSLYEINAQKEISVANKVSRFFIYRNRDVCLDGIKLSIKESLKVSTSV